MSIESILASGKTPKDVDKLALDLLEEGDAPDYIAKNWWTWVTITGGGHTLRILVAPDYAALGDYRLALLRRAPPVAPARAHHPARELAEDELHRREGRALARPDREDRDARGLDRRERRRARGVREARDRSR
jgi:hypothetical protein